MMNDIKSTDCPLCHQDNQCEVDSGNGCWCQKCNIPEALTDLVNVKAKHKVCICSTCIARFNLNPEKFIKENF